mmetsp:Transcript_47967/g.108728  ORF Transcript_47967/g.108728 Transcript_47967/m.108728 type:complete len:226 (+) Transcript_47967:138-815(+)
MGRGGSKESRQQVEAARTRLWWPPMEKRREFALCERPGWTDSRFMSQGRKDLSVGRLCRVLLLPERSVALEVVEQLLHLGYQLLQRRVQWLHHEVDEADLALGDHPLLGLPVAQRGDGQAQALLFVPLRPELRQDPLRPLQHDGLGAAGVGYVRGVDDGVQREELVLQRQVLLVLLLALRGLGGLGLLLHEDLQVLHRLRMLPHVGRQDHLHEGLADVLLEAGAR